MAQMQPFYVSPIWPDLHMCSAVYGQNILLADCQSVLNRRFFWGDMTARTYPLPTSGLLYTATVGTCTISIEVNGPVIPLFSNGSPRLYKDITSWVLNQCVILENGHGGFVIFGLFNLAQYTLFPQDPVNYVINDEIQFSRFPTTTAFLTVTISGPNGVAQGAGNQDPSVPFQIAKFNYLQQQKSTPTSEGNDRWKFNALRFTQVGASNGRGSGKNWFSQGATLPPDDMAYECDSGLGSPSEVDCAKLEFSELGPPSDTISISPDNPTFLHSSTCFLGISASTSITLTWTQIRTALDNLLGICVQNPVSSSQGGRAYYAPQPIAHIDRRTRKRQNTVTGSNALPPGVTLSIFNQQEPWTNPAVEAKSCTWTAVLEKHAISTCPSS